MGRYPPITWPVLNVNLLIFIFKKEIYINYTEFDVFNAFFSQFTKGVILIITLYSMLNSANAIIKMIKDQNKLKIIIKWSGMIKLLL